MTREQNEYVRWFGELDAGDVSLVGGKNASLGEMLRALKDEGVRVPDAFATTADTYVGICGQAPSDYPDFVAFLVRAGIDSISLNPDSVLDVKRRVAKAEHSKD